MPKDFRTHFHVCVNNPIGYTYYFNCLGLIRKKKKHDMVFLILSDVLPSKNKMYRSLWQKKKKIFIMDNRATWDLSHLTVSSHVGLPYSKEPSELVYVLQSCLIVCNPMDRRLLGYSVHGTSQARILVWTVFSFSRWSSWPTDWTRISYISRWILHHWATREAPVLYTCWVEIWL